MKELTRMNAQLGTDTMTSLFALKQDLLTHAQDTENRLFALELGHISQVNLGEGLLTVLKAFAGEALLVSKKQAVLLSLRFQHIAVRHAAIKQAHQRSFDWMFDNSKTKF